MKAYFDELNNVYFTCQHGPAECDLNREHSCALHEIKGSVKFDEQQSKMMNYVNCAMSPSFKYSDHSRSTFKVKYFC